MASAAFAGASLIVRQHAAAGRISWIIYGVSLAAGAGFAVWRAQRIGFCDTAAAFVRLEGHLDLR